MINLADKNEILEDSEGKIFDVPRVSSIIEATQSEEEKERLNKWSFKQKKKHGESKFKEKQEETLRKGTLLHSDIENFILNKGLPSLHPHFKYLKPHLEGILNTNKKENIFCEERFFSELGFTGRYDLCCQYLGKRTIIDWTTSYRNKTREWLENKFLQCGAYKIGFEEKYQLEVSQLAVFVIYPKGASCHIYPFFKHDNLSVFEKEYIENFLDPYDINHYSKKFMERFKLYKEMQNGNKS